MQSFSFEIMSGIASATGLLQARIRPIRRPKPKCVELSGSFKPAPLILRPFSGLFNPYPYGCSVLCNHPADWEAREILRRAKYSWAGEGKTLLLPEEMDMIKANLVVTAGAADVDGNNAREMIDDPATVPEELFRKYTDTDSRPLTPAATIASGPASTNRQTQEEFPVSCKLRERTTLVLDLRTNSQKQLENETFTWHALTLEPPPAPRKANILLLKANSKRTSKRLVRSPHPPVDATDSLPSTNTNDPLCSSKNVDGNEEENHGMQVTMIRRRGRKLRKGKCRRGSAYGQVEVRDLFESTETQISHIGDGSGRTSTHTNDNNAENENVSLKKTSALSNTPSIMLSSFIDLNILKHLCRELTIDKIEAEFSIRRRIAFEEALRVKGESYSRSRWSQAISNPVLINTPRVFSRQTARFEILGSESIRELTVLEYLGKHVSVSTGRKFIFGKVFNKFQQDTAVENARYISPNDIHEALEEVIGKRFTKEGKEYIQHVIGQIEYPLNFRTWCGLCAALERLLCPLPSRDVDPPTWLERVDFEPLERRLRSTSLDLRLARFLKEIQKK